MRAESTSAAGASVIARLAEAPAFASLVERLEKGGVCLDVVAPLSAAICLAAVLHQRFPPRLLVVVAPDLKTQEIGYQDLQTWLGISRRPPAAVADLHPREAGPLENPRAAGGTDSVPPSAPAPRLLFYPAWDILPHEGRLPHADVISERLETLVALSDHARRPADRAPLIVASSTALLQCTFAAADLGDRLRLLRRGDTVNPLDLVEWLEDQAYEPEAQVTQKGELALRGGILDVFPLSSPWPVRLEFMGDVIESLRTFDPNTQVSREEIEQVTLSPAGELGILRRTLASADSGIHSARTTLLDYLPPSAVVMVIEPELGAEQVRRYAEQIPANDPYHLSRRELDERLAAHPAARLEVREPVDPGRPPGDGWVFQSLDAFRPLAERAPEPEVASTQRRLFFTQLHRWLRQGYAVEVFCNNDGERQRFLEIWQEYDRPGDAWTGATGPAAMPDLPATEAGSARLGAAPGEAQPGHPEAAEAFARLRVEVGGLSRGFLCEASRLVVVTDAEVFGRYKVSRPRRLSSPHAAAVRSVSEINFTEFEEGDYVVHLQHGIGRYLGLEQLPPPPKRRGVASSPAGAGGEECLVIEYAPSDPEQPPPRLYVPVTEAHLVSKYVGAGKGRPPLNSLGGTRWLKTKAKAAEAVRDLAAELLGLQAARASQPGYAFPADAPWQREFEAAFVYEETPDQLRAIEETKRDLEAPKPMDRLICGDVGFGKTEVAIRAAFKSVLAGKQVAILVPTTVLAQQHYTTFRERMADYPVRIELLSRFRSRRHQDAVVADLARGAVDIVIGTHRLIQADVVFKDLGLVIVDEEQRFGVAHKERLKQLRQLVDVLTLSATPIPRTLYLALTGARDMSTIETPPQDRLPVETIIAPYDERLIRDAIQRELNRGGQVFYLHNRIFDIDAVALRLRALVPQARLAVGHGQMHADDLEEVMTRFVAGEVDVLLSTTIIESGIDIPNANTIIIDRADRFGLSDLYQLRGRVGRYKHQAYAYLLIPRHAGLLADARKRISAIKQFSTPGSGFKIAMRDLEIRGAGNLLGAEQSGHITAVGFDLYCQLLKHSIAALRGEKLPPRVEVQVRLDFLDLNPAADASPPPGEAAAPAAASPPQPPRPRTRKCASACLPLVYVPDSAQRIELYRKLAQASDPPALEAVRAELRDRFGPLPPAVELLLAVAALKLDAATRGVTAIETREDKLILTRHGDFVQVGGRFPRLIRKEPKARLKEIRRVLGALPPVNRSA